MKNIATLMLAAIMMISCTKTEVIPQTTDTSTSYSSSSGSHYCGYPTKNGGTCKRKVAGSTGYCWQHR
ncbi:hypothetical protein [Taibaiella helva]|uniref:hypothetical protein n=1 Tax=Taibaiella helva TaxID=2301235 RepID=UPI000E58B415|nr:hypothetical protein [Taibaiella helva]